MLIIAKQQSLLEWILRETEKRKYGIETTNVKKIQFIIEKQMYAVNAKIGTVEIFDKYNINRNSNTRTEKKQLLKK